MRRGVDQVFPEGHRAGKVAQRRVGLTSERGTGAEDLLGDFGGGVATVVGGHMIGVDNDEVAVAEIGDGRLRFGIARRVGDHLQLALTIDGVAGRVVFAEVDVLVAAGAGQVIVGVVEADDKATRGQASDCRLVLAAGRRFVNLEFSPDLGAGRVVALAVDAGTVAILTIRTPDDDEAAVGEGSYRWFILGTSDIGVNQKFTTDKCPGTAITLAIDSGTAAVLIV